MTQTKKNDCSLAGRHGHAASVNGMKCLLPLAIILLWLENQSYEEIAAIVGISVKNVSVRLLRIKKKLMEMSND